MGTMDQWLGSQFLSLGVPHSKPLGDSKGDSAFCPSQFDQIGTRNSWGFTCKSKLSPHSGSVALRQLNPIQGKHKVFFSITRKLIKGRSMMPDAIKSILEAAHCLKEMVLQAKISQVPTTLRKKLLASLSKKFPLSLHAFLTSNTFISNASLKLAKN